MHKNITKNKDEKAVELENVTNQFTSSKLLMGAEIKLGLGLHGWYPLWACNFLERNDTLRDRVFDGVQ